MENLRQLRKAKNFTQKELGEMCDVSESMIGLLENGNRNPSYELLLKLGEALECSVDELLRGEKNTALDNESGYTTEEDELVRAFRLASPETRAAMLTLLRSAEAPRATQDDGEANR